MASPHSGFASQQLSEVADARSPTYATVGPHEEYEYYEPPPASPPPPSQPVPQYDIHPQSYTQSYISPHATSEQARSPQSSIRVNEKDRPLSPSTLARYSEVTSPDPEAIPENLGDKEVYRYKAYPIAAPSSPQQATPPVAGKGICRLPKKWVFAIALLLLCSIIAIAVSLGVVLGTRHTHTSQSAPTPPSATSTSSPTPTGDPDYSIGGAYSPEYYSASGAFNGSGIAIASVNFGDDASIYVFFQKYTGEIVQYISHADGNWDEVTTIATNARNSTPLSAVAYIVDEVATWHLFYIDKESYVRQRISSNESAFETNIWSDGQLNDLNLKANEADMIGLQACYWGNFYGDTDSTYADGFNASRANSSAAPQTGMHLYVRLLNVPWKSKPANVDYSWYATSDTTFDQYSWTNGDSQWKKDQVWENMNGRAGVGCQTWLSGTSKLKRSLPALSRTTRKTGSIDGALVSFLCHDDRPWRYAQYLVER